MEQHLAELRRRDYSPATIYQRERVLTRLRNAIAPTQLVHASTSQLVHFLDRLKNPASRTAERGHLVSFYRWLVLEGYREDDPTVRIPKPRQKRWLPRPMPEEDVHRAVLLAPERVRPWLLLAGYAGLRACEIAPLRGEDIWWHAAPPIIVIERSKGGDPSTVPIAPILEKELHRWPARGYLWPRFDGRPQPLAPHNVSQLANDYLHSLGIWHTLHSLRHRFGTQVLRASGGDLRQTQELLRHRSIASTTVYTEIDKSESAGIVAALPT